MSRTLHRAPYTVPVERLVALLFDLWLCPEPWHCPTVSPLKDNGSGAKGGRTFSGKNHILSAGNGGTDVLVLPAVSMDPADSPLGETWCWIGGAQS